MPKPQPVAQFWIDQLVDKRLQLKANIAVRLRRLPPKQWEATCLYLNIRCVQNNATEALLDIRRRIGWRYWHLNNGRRFLTKGERQQRQRLAAVIQPRNGSSHD